MDFLNGSWDIFGMKVSKKIIVFGILAIAAIILIIVIANKTSVSDVSTFISRGTKKAKSAMTPQVSRYGQLSPREVYTNPPPPTRSGYTAAQTWDTLANESLQEDLYAIQGRTLFSADPLPAAPLSTDLRRLYPNYTADEWTSNPLVRTQRQLSNPGIRDC